MEKIIGIKTDFGIIEGRDGIYLDSISHPNETELILKGEFNTNSDFKKYEIKFSGIIYLHSIELDFDERGQMASFGFVDNSTLIGKFRKKDHSDKLNPNHNHFYFRTYDTVYEIVADKYDLKT
jgi:hypothetical protein